MSGLITRLPTAAVVLALTLAIAATTWIIVDKRVYALRQDIEDKRAYNTREIQETLSSVHRDLEMVNLLIGSADGDVGAASVAAYLTARRHELTAVLWLGYAEYPQGKSQTLLSSAVVSGFDYRRDRTVQAMVSRSAEQGLTAGVPATFQEVATLALVLPTSFQASKPQGMLIALIDANELLRGVVRETSDEGVHLQLLLGDQTVARIPARHLTQATTNAHRVSLGTEDFALVYEEPDWWSLASSQLVLPLTAMLGASTLIMAWAYVRQRHPAPVESAVPQATSLASLPPPPSLHPAAERKPELDELNAARMERLWQVGDLTALLAHDLGQPLNIIRLNAESGLDALANGRAEPDRMRRSLEIVADQSLRAQTMMDALAAATRRSGLKPAPFSPVTAVRDALAQVQGRIRDQNIRLQWHPQAKCPPVTGHEHRFRAALVQLLTNACEALALKALKEDADEQACLSVTCHEEGAAVTITIVDNGPGFPPALRSSLTSRFPEAGKGGKGCGLGLAIAFGVVAEMGGTLSIEDGEPGTRVSIGLPAAENSGARQVLLVDDEAEAARAMADYLCGRGWDVRVAHGGNEALRMYTAQPADAVVTDLHMGGGDGWTLIERLRAHSPDLPIIAVSTAREDEAKRAVAAGAMLCLSKPASLEEIAEELEEAFANA